MPLLWIYGAGEAGQMVVNVRATAGDSWAFYEAHRGWSGYLAGCDDVQVARDRNA
ncbi:hypothetical protein Acsp03_64560 [Actinomadura sp. NBRC 104412]|uniref:hypothetical protein n=1 Tax=Actinomadura sp. NBRC 104412 TaxID=3032203 RepID=UPI0024A01C3C|nr:hypothetical protein [Actinomadura sp. NBRC 104412]GLZ08990.1 hypothetical protein Acsp03_64560 [Actinomadura sp. NBRC 104412]